MVLILSFFGDQTFVILLWQGFWCCAGLLCCDVLELFQSVSVSQKPEVSGYLIVTVRLSHNSITEISFLKSHYTSDLSFIVFSKNWHPLMFFVLTWAFHLSKTQYRYNRVLILAENRNPRPFGVLYSVIQTDTKWPFNILTQAIYSVQ